MPVELKYLNNLKTQELITEIKRRLALKQDVMQFLTMPAITVSMVGNVYQYIGDSTNTYKSGDFYKVTVDTLTHELVYEQITYNKDEIDTLIEAAGHFAVVDELPTDDIKTNVIYLIPKMQDKKVYEDTTNNLYYYPTGDDTTPSYAKFDDDGKFIENVTGIDAETIKGSIDNGTFTLVIQSIQIGQVNNIKDEFINLDGTITGWEKIGDTKLDLSDYVQFENLIPITSAELADMWLNDGVLSISSLTVTVAVGDDEIVTATATGTISAVSEDDTIATVSISGGNITITGVAAGITTVTVTSAPTIDYRAVTRDITVTVE